MAVINVTSYFSCIPADGKTDPETGCRSCGENAQANFEQCRQSFYAKQQNEILKSSAQEKSQVAESNSALEEVRQQNTELKQANEEQAQQLLLMSEQVDQTSHKIDNLSTINVALFLALILLVAYVLLHKRMPRR